MNESAPNCATIAGAPQTTSPDLKIPGVAGVEQLVAKHPTVCLVSAFALGAALAWWIKRK